MQTINITDGSATYLGTKNQKMWLIRWKSGVAMITPSDPKANSMGNLLSVSGEIYQKNKVASTYTADRGQGDKQKQKLTLTDHVHVVASNPAVTIDCDHMTYDGRLKIIRAKGHVHVTGALSTVGTLEEIWTTPDLQLIATPEMFNQL